MPKGKALRPSEVLAKQLRTVREGARPRLTTEALAKRVEELQGFPMHPTTITKIEKGDRKVTVDEWLTFAAALNVPPALLLLPLGTDDRVRITSGSQLDPDLVFDWLVGDQPLATTDGYAINSREWRVNAEPLLLHLSWRKAEVAVRAAIAGIKRAEGTESDSTAARRKYVNSLENLARVFVAYERAGSPPPKIQSEWKRDMERFGIDSGRTR
jgi:hypothetical protein